MMAVQAGSIFAGSGPLQSSRSPACAEPGTPHRIMNAAAPIRRTNGIDMAGRSFETKMRRPGTSEQAEKLYNRDGRIAITVWHAAPGRKPLHPARTSVK